MARSCFLAAYKSPRELLWLSGLLLGILLTLFAFTGQLLPYDQHGYWATVVGIRIASSAPSLGEMIRAVLTGGYGDIGATTLARFYVLHVCVLPLVFLALVALHLGMLQRVGSAGPTSGPREPIRPFFPTQVYKDVLVAAAGAAALFLTAGLLTATDTGPANPAAGDFVPRPEWFFLAHYEILRVLPGKWQILGTFVLPNALLGLLVVLPFIDRGTERSPRRRKFATIAGLAVCAVLIGLTIKGVASAPHTAGKTDAASTMSPAQRGRALFVEKKCVTCHSIEGLSETGTKGPNLTHVASRIRSDYFPQWIRNPRNFKPTTEMPAFEGSEDELSSIVEYLLTLK